jgi:hypothetical protein
MATKFESVSGSYDKTVEDSSHQDSKKFTKTYGKPTDDLSKPSQSANKPKDSKDHSV